MILTLFCISLLKLLTFISLISAGGNRSTPGRLPTYIEPVSYTIELKTHIEKTGLKLEGHTNITIKVNNETDKIILHADNLHIRKIKLFTNTSTLVQIRKFTSDRRFDFLTITLTKSLPIGRYKLTFDYDNSDNGEEFLGFIHRSYNDSGNQKSLIAFTRLKQSGARKVFPCWDEPRMKANFTITVHHSSSYGVLSNMEIEHGIINRPFNTEMTTYFPETPKMSTFQIQIAILNYDFTRIGNTAVQLYARRNIINKMSFLLKSATKIIEFMNEYIGISLKSLGFERLKIVLIPDIGEEVASMENLGLIFLPEMDYYVDANIAAVAQYEEQIMKSIAHACVHQWFGSLVTPRWWKDLWMYKGIVSYFQYFIVDQIESSWHIMDKFALDIDRESTNVKHYKTTHLIRMAAYIIGDGEFQQVWKHFFKENLYQAVTAKSIIDEFVKAADIKIGMFRKIFDDWLNTPGFPILDIKRNYETNEVLVKQQGYLYPSNFAESPRKKYWVPINCTTENSMNFSVTNNVTWMRPNDTTLHLTGFSSDEWVIFNRQHFVYYSVNYDEINWGLISRTLRSENFTEIHVWIRLQLIHDAFELLRAEKISHGLVLFLMSYLKRETDVIPWIPVLNGVKFLKAQLENTKYMKPFKNFIAHLMDKLIENVKFDESSGDSHLLNYYRADLLIMACESGSESCQRAALNKFIQWMNNSTEIQLPLYLQSIILCSGLHKASEAVWDKLWQEWLRNQSIIINRALACTSNSTLQKKLLVGVTDYDKKHQTNHLSFAIGAIASGSDHGVYAAIDFLSKHWETINETLNESSLKNTVLNVYKNMDKNDQFYMLQDFIEQRHSDLIRIGVDPENLKDEVIQRSRRLKMIIPDYEIFFFPAEKFS